MRMDSRGVSDTVGFVLVFGLITVVIATAFTGGMAGLESTQQAEQDANVERAFDVFDNNMRDIYYDGAPSRTTEIKLAGSSLDFDKRSRLTVVVDPDGSNREITNRSVHSLVYRGSIGTEIRYEAGAVIRTDGGSSVMLASPGVITDDKRILIPFIRTRSVSPGVSGDTTVLLRAGVPPDGRTVNTEPIGPDESVEITVESERAATWESYLESEGFAITKPADDETVTATIEAERMYVSRTTVDLSIEH